MTSATLVGKAASPGAAIGRARVLDGAAQAYDARRSDDWPAEAARATAALEAAAAELEASAERLRGSGHAAEAEIVASGALMALDPALATAVETAVRYEHRTAAAAIVQAAQQHAAAIAAIDDEYLAARADDVRALGRRAARLALGSSTPDAAAGSNDVLVANDLGPADVAELEGVAAIALAAGGVTAHAAIVARSLGIPLVVGTGPALLAVANGTELLVDGDRGSVIVAPSPPAAADARRAMAARERLALRAVADGGRPAVTVDGRTVRVFTNAAAAPEVRAGLAAGAEGVGLLRTELAFLEAERWPSEEDHRRLLDAVATALGPRLLTVRLLDFGGDKTPPFLAGVAARGIALLLEAPEALAAQIAAIAALTDRVRIRVLVPLVEHPEQLEAVLEELPSGLNVGAMIETPGAAAHAHKLAELGDFLSVGTNDLTAATFGTDRFTGGSASAHHPRVLAHIDRSARAARSAEIPIEVCGEAASDRIALPLLVGLGIDELSAGAARVGVVRSWIRALSVEAATSLAVEALLLDDEQAVVRLVAERLGGRLDEVAEEGGEATNGGLSIRTVGA